MQASLSSAEQDIALIFSLGSCAMVKYYVHEHAFGVRFAPRTLPTPLISQSMKL